MAYANGFSWDKSTGAVTADDPNGFVKGADPTAGDVKAPDQYGGYAAGVTIGPDGKPVVDYSHNGLNDAMNRYQGLGAAAIDRSAYQANYAKADQLQGQSDQDRNGENMAMANLRSAAEGKGPTVTTGMGRAMADQSLTGAMGMTAGARPGGLAAATQGAYGQQVGRGVMSAGQIMGARAGELSQARGGYMQGASSMHGQDLQDQSMQQQRAITQANSEMQQRQLNQQRQMGMEGLAANARAAQLAANQKQEETQLGIYGNSLSISNQEKNRAQANLGAAFNAGGATLGATANAMNGQGQGYGGMGSYAAQNGYQGTPIQRQDPYGDGGQPPQDQGYGDYNTSDPYGDGSGAYG